MRDNQLRKKGVPSGAAIAAVFSPVEFIRAVWLPVSLGSVIVIQSIFCFSLYGDLSSLKRQALQVSETKEQSNKANAMLEKKVKALEDEKRRLLTELMSDRTRSPKPVAASPQAPTDITISGQPTTNPSGLPMPRPPVSADALPLQAPVSPVVTPSPLNPPLPMASPAPLINQSTIQVPNQAPNQTSNQTASDSALTAIDKAAPSVGTAPFGSVAVDGTVSVRASDQKPGFSIPPQTAVTLPAHIAESTTSTSQPGVTPSQAPVPTSPDQSRDEGRDK